MSTIAATIAALALSVATLVPIAWAATGRHVWVASGVFISMLLAIGVYQTGILIFSLAPTNMPVRVIVPSDSRQCREVRELMEQSGLSIDRSDLAAPKVVGPGAEQIPADVSDVLIQCFESQESEQPGSSNDPGLPGLAPTG